MYRSVTVLVLLPVLAAAAPGAPIEPPPPVPTAQPLPAVEDSMLAAASRPANVVGSWAEALRLLRERSTNARTAEADIEVAQGRWRQALSLLLPNFRGTASAVTDLLHPDSPAAVQGAPSQPGGSVRPTAPLGLGTLALTQSVIDLPAWKGLEASAAAQRSAEASAGETHRRMTQGLARSLVAVVAAERVADLNRVGLRQSLERAALTRRTAELGAATQLDVVRAQQDVAVARGDLVAGDEQLRRVREALAIALGFDAETGVRPDFTLETLEADARAACPATPYERRPDLVAARESVASARAATTQARRSNLPVVGVQTGVSAYTSDPGFARVPAWSLSAVLTVPLWDGGQREGLVRERAGLEAQADVALEATRRDVRFEVARARRGVAVASDRVKAAAEARELAERTDALTRRSFEIGRASSLELVQTASALRAADVALAAREFELVQARVDAVLTEATCNW